MNVAFKELSATVVGINEVREVFEEAKGALKLTGRYVFVIGGFGGVASFSNLVRIRRTILFLDEIHRFTKAQQDVFLRGFPLHHLLLNRRAYPLINNLSIY
jgi:putative ATPase